MTVLIFEKLHCKHVLFLAKLVNKHYIFLCLSKLGKGKVELTMACF